MREERILFSTTSSPTSSRLRVLGRTRTVEFADDCTPLRQALAVELTQAARLCW